MSASEELAFESEAVKSVAKDVRILLILYRHFLFSIFIGEIKMLERFFSFHQFFSFK